jgi:hypothetical protein
MSISTPTMYPLPIYSAKDTAITQRPTSTALLCIDSEDRFRDYPAARVATEGGLNATPYNFQINKNQSLMNGFFTRLAVSEVVFPWGIPNINRWTYKVNFTYTVGGAAQPPVIVELEYGFYTPSMIASAIQTIVRAADPANLGAFTMTYGTASIAQSYATQRPIFEYFTNDVAVECAFSPVVQEAGRKQLFDLLGFYSIHTVLEPELGGAETYCQYTRYVDIVCTQLTANQALKDTMSQPVARDVLCRVYVGDAQGVQSTVLPSSSTFCPPGCMPTTIYKDFSQPKQIMWMPNQPVPGYLKFEVYDDAGFELTSTMEGLLDVNGLNWSLSLLVSEN